jgi:hypothetical protein
MALIFINFRNGDGQWAAKLLKDTLAARFGADRVFLSSDSIRLAAQSSDVLLETARTCDVLLALIGPDWLTAANSKGQAKLFMADDWVRREIAAALRAGRNVAPVLLDGTPQLAADQLPPDIRELANRQGGRLSRRQFDTDAHGLAESLIEIVPGLRSPDRPPGIRVRSKLVLDDGTESHIRMADIGATDRSVDVESDARIKIGRGADFEGPHVGVRPGKAKKDRE